VLTVAATLECCYRLIDGKAQEGREVRRDVFGTSIDTALSRFRQQIAEFDGRTIRPLSLMAEVILSSNFEWANNAT
jgi:hypothetical protein